MKPSWECRASAAHVSSAPNRRRWRETLRYGLLLPAGGVRGRADRAEPDRPKSSGPSDRGVVAVSGLATSSDKKVTNPLRAPRYRRVEECLHPHITGASPPHKTNCLSTCARRKERTAQLDCYVIHNIEKGPNASVCGKAIRRRRHQLVVPRRG